MLFLAHVEKKTKKQFGFSDGGSKSGSAEVSSVCNSLRLPGPASASQCPLRLPNPPITGGINTHGGQQGGGAAAGSPASRLRTDVPESVSQGIIFLFTPLLTCCCRLQVCFIIGRITFFIALMGYLIDTQREDLPLLRRPSNRTKPTTRRGGTINSCFRCFLN